MPGPIEFGLFDWIDFSAPEQAGALYEQRLQLLEHADAAGFYCYHLAEHHLTPLSATPSPGMFLAAASQRTRRLRLGALVFLLPLYHPVRLAQEICMLDHLSGGRLELGTGRGVNPHELRLLGAAYQDARGQYDEAFEILLELLSTSKLRGYQGKHYQYEALDMLLEPVQRPYPPLWYPVVSADRARWAGSNALNVVIQRPADASTRAIVQAHAEAWEENRDAPGRLNPHVERPLFGLVRQVYVADSHEKAQREAKAAYDKHGHSFLYLWNVFGEAQNYAAMKDWQGQQASGGLLVGTPEEVRERVEEQLDATGVNYLIANFTFGDLSTAQVLGSFDAFAGEVMPKLKTASPLLTRV